MDFHCRENCGCAYLATHPSCFVSSSINKIFQNALLHTTLCTSEDRERRYSLRPSGLFNAMTRATTVVVVVLYQRPSTFGGCLYIHRDFPWGIENAPGAKAEADLV